MKKRDVGVIGIDIGDTNFRISYLDGESPRLIRDPSGRTSFPSKVSFLQGGGSYVGIDAEMFGIPENTVMHPMTIIGASFPELQQLNSQNVYQFKQEDGAIYIDAHRAFPRVSEVLTAIFAHAKKLAEDDLGFEVYEAVIAIPDGANDPKRIAIKQCAEAAGLAVKQLLNQTTAAAFGFRFDLGTRKRFAVIDVGASHTSLSILNGGMNRIEMLSTSHCSIGANNFQWRLVELINELAKNEYNIDMLASGQDHIKQTIVKEAVDVMVGLSKNESMEISIGCALPDGGRMVTDVPRRDFERKISNELRSIESIIANAMSVDMVLLIGGGSNIPAVRQIVDKIFRKPPFISPAVNSAEAVAIGAAVKGGILDGVILSQSVERTVHDLGTFFHGDMMDVLIPKGTQFPCHVSKEYSMGTSEYWEKVYQWTLNGSGQNHHEDERGLVVLAKKFLKINGRNIRCTFIIDVHGVAQFVVTDLSDNQQYTLTDFDIQ